jgi:hypothetical protein
MITEHAHGGRINVTSRPTTAGLHLGTGRWDGPEPHQYIAVLVLGKTPDTAENTALRRLRAALRDQEQDEGAAAPHPLAPLEIALKIAPESS